MNPARTLSIRVFAARDETAFDKGNSEEIATTFLPLWRVPEVCPSASEQGLSEIWLSLDVPCPSSLKGAASTLDEGGEVQVEVEAELLGFFERSRELAATNSSTPRICVIVQARSDISSAMAKLVRSNSPPLPMSMSPPVGTALQQQNGETSGQNFEGEAGPRLSESRPAVFQTPITTEEEDSPNRASAVSKISLSSDLSPVAQKHTSSDSFWRARCEEEKRRYEETRKKYSKQLQGAKAIVAKKDRMLLQAGGVLESRALRKFKSATIEAWNSWMSEERRQRQFKQISDDDLQFQKMRDERMSQLTGQLKDIEDRCRAHDLLLQRASVRRGNRLNIVEKVWCSDFTSWLSMLVVDSWRQFRIWSALQQKRCMERYRLMQRELLCLAVCTWRGELGLKHLEEMRRRVSEAEKVLPRRTREAVAVKVAGALYWSRDRGVQEGQAHKVLCMVLASWGRFTSQKAGLRKHVTRMLESSLHKSADVAILVTCLVMWRSCCSSTPVAVASSRALSRQRLASSRSRAASVVTRTLYNWYCGSTRAFLICWHFHAAHCKLKRELERIYIDQVDDRDRNTFAKRELDDIRTSLDAETRAWEDERLLILEDLRIEETELQKSKATYQDALNERRLLEKQHVDASIVTQNLVNELARAESETLRVTENLQATEKASAYAEFEAQSREAAYEEIIENTIGEARKLQTEAVKQQDRRQKDVRDLRQRLRTQVLRHEEGVRRLEQSCQDDESQWSQKLRHSEARCSRLENDVQAARRSLHSLPGRAEAIEAENKELFANCEKAEARLREAEEAEHKRRADLSRLRSANADVKSKTEELEQRLQQFRDPVLGKNSSWEVVGGDGKELSSPGGSVGLNRVDSGFELIDNPRPASRQTIHR
jgi:hypothetical protein